MTTRWRDICARASFPVEATSVSWLSDKSTLGASLPRLGVGMIGAVGDIQRGLQLDESEADLVTGVSARRRAQFTTGRHLAHQALDALGLRHEPLLSTESGAPRWPAGVTGSISHARSLAATVVSNTSRYAGVGIDLEQSTRVSERVARRVLTQNELDLLHNPSQAAVLFSAKEAGYKAVNPLKGRYITFQEAEIDVDWELGQFTIRYLGSQPDNAVLEYGVGVFGFVGEHVITVFWILND